MTLGVVKKFQTHGIGSVLITRLIDFVSRPSNRDIHVVYLHVLATNLSAIRFYERRRFQQHAFLPGYYRIRGKEHDGFTYVLYINGGKAPWGFSKKVSQFFCPTTSNTSNIQQQEDDIPPYDSLSGSSLATSLTLSFCRASSSVIRWIFG